MALKNLDGRVVRLKLLFDRVQKTNEPKFKVGVHRIFRSERVLFSHIFFFVLPGMITNEILYDINSEGFSSV